MKNKKLLCSVCFLFTFMSVLWGQNITVKGNVTSKTDGQPIIGASVVQNDSKSTGTITDLDGNFTLSVPTNALLAISYIGYKEVIIAAKPSLKIVMEEDAKMIDEVVVTGYMAEKKASLTGSVAVVKMKEVADIPTGNVMSGLQGRVAGMNVTTDGKPGGGNTDTKLRGITTINNSSPLYVIDGVQTHDNVASIISSNDVESIQVLKDAASAAIYGAQAANGVVLVTTKSGKEGTCRISYDGFAGWQTIGRKYSMLNASEYMSIMDEARLNSGMSPVDWASLSSIHDARGNIYDTDWIDQAIEDGGLTTSHNLSFTGGSKTSTYAISGGYTGQDGLIGGSDVSYYKRYNFRVNSEHKMWNGLVTVGEHVGFVWKDTRGMGTGNIWNNNLRSAFSASPIIPVYDADGNYNSTVNSDWNVNDGNPYGNMMVNRYNNSKNGSLDANVYVQIEPIKNLRFKTVYGISYGASEYRAYTPKYQFTPQTANTVSKVNQSHGHGLSMVWTNTLSYDFNIATEHHINALIGSELSTYDGSNTEGSNTGLIPGFDDWDHAYLVNTNGTENKTVKGSPYDSTRGMSYFARLGWTWKERYMVNATMRADGSSKFAKGNRWGYFPSVSAGWTISEEKFMESVKSWFDFLKIRVSWGQVGNANINCYQYLAPVSTTNTNYNFGSGGGQDAWVTGSYTSRLANEKVKWETSEQYNVGIDARFLNGRLALTADGYIKNTKDWLVQAPVLATAGTSGPIINGGDVKNQGVELGLSWNDQIGKDFTYSVGANLAYNHNEVGSIPTEDGIIHGATNQIYSNAEEFYRAENGRAIGYFWGFKTAGIFQNKQEINDWIAAGNGVYQSSVQPGDVKYVDVNHDGVIDAKDKVDLGNGLPKYTFGFNINLGYKQ